MGTNRHLKELRTPEEVQAHQAFVEAWSGRDPKIAPFLGNWMGWEDSLIIYPSTQKGKVCLVFSGYGVDGSFSSFTTGTVTADNRLLTDKNGFMGSTTFKFKPAKSGDPGSKTDFLVGFSIFENKGRLGINLHPRALGADSSNGDSNISLRLNRHACTSKTPSQLTSQKNPKAPKSVQEIADGTYGYHKSHNNANPEYIIISKRKNHVIGYYFEAHTDGGYCLMGTLQGNTIDNVTNAEPRFGRNVSGFDLVKGRSHQLDSYQSIDTSQIYTKYANTRNHFQECLGVFKR
jgi:hypothetical protein